MSGSVVGSLTARTQGLGLASTTGTTIGPLKHVSVAGYLQTQAANKDNHDKVKQLMSVTTGAAQLSAIKQGKYHGGLTKITDNDFKTVLCPQVGKTAAGDPVVVVSLTNELDGNPMLNTARVDSFTSAGYVPVSDVAHKGYLDALDGDDTIFAPPTTIEVGSDDDLHGDLKEGTYHVYIFPKVLALKNGSTPCQGPADEALISSLESASDLGVSAAFWCNCVAEYNETTFASLQEKLSARREELGLTKIKNGCPHDKSSNLLKLEGIPATNLSYLTEQIGLINQKFTAAAQIQCPIPRKVPTAASAHSMTGTMAGSDADSTLPGNQNMNVLKYESLGASYRKSANGTWETLPALVDDEWSLFLRAKTMHDRSSSFNKIRQTLAESDGLDMLTLNAGTDYLPAIIVTAIGVCNFATTPIRGAECLARSPSLLFLHLGPRAKSILLEEEQKDTQRNFQLAQGEKGTNLHSLSTKLHSITTLTHDSALRSMCTLLNYLRSSRKSTLPDGSIDIITMMEPLLGLCLKQAFRDARSQTKESFPGTDTSIVTHLDRIITSYFDFGLATRTLRCVEQKAFEECDYSALDRTLKYIDVAMCEVTSFISSHTEIPKGIVWLCSAEKKLYDHRKREELKKSLMAELGAQKPPARKSPPHNAAQDRPPAKAPRGDTAGDIIVREGVRRMDLPPRGSLLVNPCGAFLREGFYCRHGQNCRNDHTRINDLSDQDQKAWVRHVTTHPDLNFNTERVNSRIANMSLASAARE